MYRKIRAVALIGTMWMGADGRAGAQSASPFYAGVGIGGVFVSADAVGGGAAAVSGTVGASIRPWLDLETEVVAPGDGFSRTYAGDSLSLSFAEAAASAGERERLGVWLRYENTRRISVIVSAVAVMHWAVAPRARLGLVAGIGTTRARDERRYIPVRIGSGLDPNHPAAQLRVEEDGRLLGGPTIGARFAWRVADRVTVAPDVRLDYGSLGDEINNAVRLSVKVVWRL